MARNVFTQCPAFVLATVLALVVLHVAAVAGPMRIPTGDVGGSGSLAPQDPNGQATTRLFEEVLSGRVSGVCSLLMAAGSVSHTPAGDFTGPDEFERYVTEAWGAFPDATFSIDEQVSSHDQLTVRWTMTGRYVEAPGGVPASGAEVALVGLAVFRFEGGMIVESWLQYDRMALVEQIEAATIASDICPPCVMP